MKRSFFLAATLYLLFLNFAIGQENRTPEKIKQDSIEREQFKKKYPEYYRNNRKAIFLLDGTSYVKGYNALGIRIKQNHIIDSVNHNFNLGSKGKDIVPYNDVKVSDESISIELFNNDFFFCESHTIDTSSIELIGNEHVRNGKIDAKFTGSKKWSSFLMSAGNSPLIDKKIDSIKLNTQTENGYEIRISINGKLLFNWRSLKSFATNTYHFAQKDILTIKDSAFGFWNTGYGQGYQIIDQKLKINDQLLIEIKDTKNGWMLDRFNLTRIGIKPNLSALTHDSSSTKTYLEFVSKELKMKDSFQLRLDRFYFGLKWSKDGGLEMKNDTYFANSRLAFHFSRPSLDFKDSSLEYKFIGGPIKDTGWTKSGHLIILDKQPPGGNYELFVRYIDNRENTARYGFKVKPTWYQSSTFKVAIALATFLLIAILFYLAYRFRLNQHENKRKKINLELQGIRSRLNPHFIFNALSSIQGLINKNDITNANLYLTEFSSLLRNSLNDSDKEFLPIKKDWSNLESYIKLEQLRFHFKYQVEIDSQIDSNTTEIPSMIMQPLVENAIKHGISGLYEKGQLYIHISRQNKDLLICIKDNGIGFDSTLEATGLGLKLTRDRIQLLNQSLKGQQIQLTIQSNQSEGSSVFLSFKNWL
jgi:hypothetical protein